MANRLTYAEALIRTWPVFIEAVRQRRTATYSEVAGRGGGKLHHRHLHRQLLNDLSIRCRDAGLPNLTCLVVRRSSGLPGGGWFDPARPGTGQAEWAAEVIKCHDHRWPDQPDPRLLAEGPPGRQR